MWETEEVMVGAYKLASVPEGALPRGWHRGIEAAKGAQFFACHSTMVLGFYGSPGFLHEHSELSSSSLPSPQAVCLQQTIAVASQDLLSRPHVPVRSPCSLVDTSFRPRHAGLWHRPTM